ncbi:MAG: NUDIX domain-containing protein [Pseudomonadales bacterium]|nr:NUDIX domain-containing protein [Pseudomonadales bacterium]
MPKTDSKKPPVTPVNAATIMLIRDGEQGLEVFMVVRHHQIDFASGALVFPGGKVDEQDAHSDWDNYLPANSKDELSVLRIAAIRESFEECGVLLAQNADTALNTKTMVSAELVASLSNERDQLNAKKLQFIDILKSNDLRLASDQLVYFAHWITPPMVPKRFDTHFFIAATPADHNLLHDGHESVDSIWITPQQAILDASSGSRTVIFPTLKNLEKLSRFNTVEEALTTTNTETVVTVTPRIEKRGDDNFLCIPENAGYTNCELKMQ